MSWVIDLYRATPCAVELFVPWDAPRHQRLVSSGGQGQGSAWEDVLVGQTRGVRKERASDYGDAHASVYDRIYGDRFVPDSAVTALATAAGPGGRLLELGIGTGRLAIPLAYRGVRVEGIEASAAMIARLRSQAGGEQIPVHRADLADFELPHAGFDVAVCAVSTIFMLPGRSYQQSCLAATARHLRLHGLLFIEAFRPDLTRFDDDGNRVEARSDSFDAHVVRSHHDAVRQAIDITHELSEGFDVASYRVTLHYASCDELDQMAGLAGLSLRERWHDWSGRPATEKSSDPVSVYARLA